MAFITDKQTITDLGIFGKPGNDSIFTMFNRTCTGGGAAILEEMFTYPLSDEVAIKERINNFRQFAKLNISFPFNTEFFGLIEHYLENNDERTRLTHDQATISKKIISFVTSDPAYKLLYKGVTSLRELLSVLWDFLHSVPLNESASFIKEKNGILTLLKEDPLFQLVQQKKGETPTPAQVVEYDTAFRFRNRPAIRQILQFVYRLDVYIAVAKTANERNLCFPHVCGQHDGLKVRQVYHPLVKQAIANTIEVIPGGNLVFLTGANMAGKSTFMKTLGIAVFLAHAGFPVAAERMEFSVMDGLYTTINLPDNLGMGASHFYAEVLRVKKVAAELHASKNLFIIFDELFRGTNVKDAYEATVAITEAFAQKSCSLFVISTHIIEAGEVLKEKCNNIQFLFLPTRMNGNVPEYTYTLQQGITNDRHGMIIIQNEGILDILNESNSK